MTAQTKTLRSFLKKVVLFIAFSAALYFALLSVFGQILPRKALKNLNYRRGGDGHMFTRLREVKETGQVDILFLGSSHAYRSFDPRPFAQAGYKTFDLASSSQTPMQTEILLEKYLDKLNPKIVVFEVYPLIFCMDGVESSVDIISNDQHDFLSLKMALATPNVRVYNALLFGLYLDLTGSNASFHEPLKKNHDTYISGGYVEKDPSYFRLQKHGPQQWTFNDAQFAAFERTIKLIQSRKINLLLVQAPVTTSWHRSYSNYDKFNERMDHYAKHIDFNEVMTLNDSLDFYDVHHVNQNGAVKFTEALLQILKKEFPRSEIHQ